MVAEATRQVLDCHLVYLEAGYWCQSFCPLDRLEDPTAQVSREASFGEGVAMSLAGAVKRRRLMADMEENKDANGVKSLMAGTFSFQPDPGPGTLLELWHWPAFAISRLCQANLSQNLERKFQSQGIVFSSDYSGVGTAEAAMTFLRNGAGRRGLVGYTTSDGRPTFQVARCGDVSEHCRKVLSAHDGPSKAECSVAAFV